MKAGRDKEAVYVLERLRGTEGERVGVAQAEYNDIRNVIKLQKSSEGTSYIHMLFGIKSGKLHTARRVQLVIWLQIIQCWTGIAGVTMYGPSKLMSLHMLINIRMLTRDNSYLPYCRLWTQQDTVGGWTEQYLLHVLDFNLRSHH